MLINHKSHQRSAYQGFFIILGAAFIWGIGNFIVGLTARQYIDTRSLLPAIDIALANIVGGVISLWIAFLFTMLHGASAIRLNRHYLKQYKRNPVNLKLVLAGIFKGINACFFVFSATYVAATESLVFESTYVLVALIIYLLFTSIRVQLYKTIASILMIFLGITLISVQIIQKAIDQELWRGLAFGIGASISYAVFLFFWTIVSASLKKLREQILSAASMLSIAVVSTILISEISVLLLLGHVWIPFIQLTFHDIIIQFINGIFEVGAVYLLLTVGLSRLESFNERANIIAAIGLSFSIPLTLLPEAIYGNFLPTPLQLVGIVVFMIGFVLIYNELRRG